MFVVYRHRCTVTGKSYTGFTSRDPQKRWLEHVKDANGGSRFHFHAAIRAHGLEAWEHDIIQECSTLDETKAAERRWIIELGTQGKGGYNETLGGDGVVGYTFTADDRHKMRIVKVDMPSNFKGKRHTGASKSLLSRHARHRKLTSEDVQRLRELTNTQTQRQLALLFGVTQSMISRVIGKVTHV